MSPHDVRLWKQSKDLTNMCPRMFKSTRDAYARLQQVKTIIADKGADFMAPCGIENRPVCDALEHLSAWNDVLAPIKVQIREVVATKELQISFGDKGYGQQESTGRLQRAIILLHWILINHACVATVQLEHMGRFHQPEWFALLCNGIGRCRRLKTLRFNAVIDDALYHRRLLTACTFLRHIEELSFEKLCEAETTGNVAILAAVIARNEKLALFKVNGFAFVHQRASAILQALLPSQSLRHLSLDVSYFRAVESRLLLQVLNANNNLKSLYLKSHVLHRYINVKTIAHALKNGTALAKLELVGFRMLTDDAWTLAASLVWAQSVQSLVLVGCMPVFASTTAIHIEAIDRREQTSGRIMPYIHILQSLRCLRRLTFDLLIFTPADQRAFLVALAENNSIEHVFVASSCRGYPSELSRLVVQTGTSNRIFSCHVVTDETNFADFPRGSMIEKLIFNARAGVPKEMLTVKACIEDLTTLLRVTKLSIYVVGRGTEVTIVKLLAFYIRNSECLSEVALNVSARKESSSLLLNAISRNTSITNLHVERWCLSRADAVVLADIISTSRTIHSVTYNQESMFPSRFFFSRLSESVGNNFTLVSVNTFERRENTKNWAIIQNTARRNAALLERGARFVAGLSIERKDAEAFELVSSSPLLPERVQELAAVDKCEAARLISILKNPRIFAWYNRSIPGSVTHVRDVATTDTASESRSWYAGLPFCGT